MESSGFSQLSTFESQSIGSKLGGFNDVGSSVGEDDSTSGASSLVFSGATSVLGGSNYQMGQLIHTVVIDDSQNAVITVAKSNGSNDVDISSFNTTGTVTTDRSNTFVIAAIGKRNSSNSTIQGGTTEDSVGINGGNPGKIDVVSGNTSEEITFEIRHLNPALTLTVKSFEITRIGYPSSGDNMAVDVTDFDGVSDDGYIPLSGIPPTSLRSFNMSSSQNLSVTGIGTGTAGTFSLGITGGDGSSYGLVGITFDVTGL